MAAENNAPVQFVYLENSHLPENVDNSTIYFLKKYKQLYVGNNLIADHEDLSPILDSKQDKLSIIRSGDGQYVTDILYDEPTSTLTIVKG